MELDTSLRSLPILEALASDARLNIINLLSKKSMNIKELAIELHMTSSIVTRHIQKLEEASIVNTKRIPGKSGVQKVCSLSIDTININFPTILYPEYSLYETSIPVGHFTDYKVSPTCGLASKENYIGILDDPKYFMDSNRMKAEIIWFTEGFVEYKIPNFLKSNEFPEMLEISMELASEFPYSNNVWPSDISFFLNNQLLGTWTCPGNFSDVRGFLTPDWWPDVNSQYGLLKHLRITPYETQMDGEHISDITLKDLDLTSELMTLRIAVEKTAQHIGGVTIFGENFGNYSQAILYKMFYSR